MSIEVDAPSVFYIASDARLECLFTTINALSRDGSIACVAWLSRDGGDTGFYICAGQETRAPRLSHHGGIAKRSGVGASWYLLPGKELAQSTCLHECSIVFVELLPTIIPRDQMYRQRDGALSNGTVYVILKYDTI